MLANILLPLTLLRLQDKTDISPKPRGKMLQQDLTSGAPHIAIHNSANKNADKKN